MGSEAETLTVPKKCEWDTKDVYFFPWSGEATDE